MRCLIFGGAGMLGSDVCRTFKINNWETLVTDINLIDDYIKYCDVRDYDSVNTIVEDFGPNAIINLAALTDLEYCEINQQDAWLTNALGAENICSIANKHKIGHVYISTAGIFDGNLNEYNDFITPNPLSVYGKSKYYGERYCLENSKYGYYVFRAGWMMGGFEKDKKFVKKIIEQLRKNVTEIYAVTDKFGTPTYTKDFSNSIYKHITNRSPYGLYNQVCNGYCNRYDVAKLIVETLGLKHNVEVIPVNSDRFDEEYFAPRPKSEVLTNAKLNSRGINYMRNWDECLIEYLKEWKPL